MTQRFVSNISGAKARTRIIVPAIAPLTANLIVTLIESQCDRLRRHKNAESVHQTHLESYPK
jgi:hypothetical protein